MTHLVEMFERLPGALIDTVTSAVQHPATIVAIVMAGAFAGAFGFVSTHFHHKGR